MREIYYQHVASDSALIHKSFIGIHRYPNICKLLCSYNQNTTFMISVHAGKICGGKMIKVLLSISGKC